MKKTIISEKIKCDTIFCHNLATLKLSINSYKGDIFLCKECIYKLKNLLKKDISKNEQAEK